MAGTSKGLVAAIAGAVVFGGIVAGVVVTRERGGAGSPLPGILTGAAPWGPNRGGLSERMDALGLVRARKLVPRSHLDLFVEGRRVRVPAGIGDGVAPIRTRAASGVVDFAAGRTLTLGDLFGVWGVRLTPSCLGGYCADGENELRVFVNGAPVPGDPRRLPLIGRQEIVVAYGTASEIQAARS